jgi:hypothetical protein
MLQYCERRTTGSSKSCWQMPLTCEQSAIFSVELRKEVLMLNICPVCGYLMEDPPTDYNICPSCGTEFGYHDVNSSIAELRANWLRTGPQWWSTTDPCPLNWDPYIQLDNITRSRESIGSLIWGAHPQRNMPIPKGLRDQVSGIGANSTTGVGLGQAA